MELPMPELFGIGSFPFKLHMAQYARMMQKVEQGWAKFCKIKNGSKILKRAYH